MPVRQVQGERPPHSGRPFSLLSQAFCSAQIVPEMVSVLVPGLTLYAPAAF